MTTDTRALALAKTLKETAGSHFTAAKRLEARDKGLTRVSAFTSAYLILLTVLPYVVEVPRANADLINLFAIALALVILVASLYQYSNGDVVNAEQHHRSGLEMNEIRREIELKRDTLTDSELCTLTDRYSAVLQKYSINHDTIDFEKYQAGRPETYSWMRWPKRLAIWCTWNWLHHLPTVMLLIVSAMTAAIVAYHAFQPWLGN